MAIIGFILVCLVGLAALVGGGFMLLICRAFGGWRLDSDFIVSACIFTFGGFILYLAITNAPFEIVLQQGI